MTKPCALVGCNEPRHKNYDWCHEHMKEAWRKRENSRRKTPPGTPKKTNNLHGPMTFTAGQTVRFQLIDWVSEKIYEFEATATGNFTVISERADGQSVRIDDAWIDGDDHVMALALRRDA